MTDFGDLGELEYNSRMNLTASLANSAWSNIVLPWKAVKSSLKSAVKKSKPIMPSLPPSCLPTCSWYNSDVRAAMDRACLKLPALPGINNTGKPCSCTLALLVFASPSPCFSSGMWSFPCSLYRYNEYFFAYEVYDSSKALILAYDGYIHTGRQLGLSGPTGCAM